MHSLLKRQLAKKLRGGLNDLDLFLEAVNESYENYESQMEMLQRAMKISSNELFEANQKLRDEAESLKEVNKNLQSILDSMNLDPELNPKKVRFDSLQYIKQQSSEIVRINKQREELLVHLEKQNKALNEYAHMVSHDLKAPLRSIDTLINWFMEDNKEMMDSKNLQSLNLILSNVEKMDLLIKGILNYSAVEQQSKDNKWIDLNVMIADVLITIAVPDHVTITLKNKLPKLLGNDFRFKQLFQNLIQNAIKYNDKEAVLIEISSSETAHDVLFEIKDNGIGIAKVYQDKIFDVFSKLHNDGKSSGIGLSIVKKIIEFYKGKIWLESQEKIGTTFYFNLPKNHGNT
ncbi:sensor histidine kinase [Flavobacterium crassostreae]|uniref:histidine kinase n=1 Tax=Flavobacterium crassostreae TaxID=1763534 RepID=A0A1B9E950_9FLAO|nr:ATP-binding protein [Flavobacterium crassostreae]OCB78474.1 two-component sensor histidine kinase [Flavobacterium crassostreae]